ncbi:MAG: hypothetical protein KatS3mg087_1405 [Patescibacteria group bacterium]|nr:MAG: hypothetical protein KatS3mg087_1405 [Patescibacteria group bacterium]
MEITLYKANNIGLISWWKVTTGKGQYVITWGRDHKNMDPGQNVICIETWRPEEEAKRLAKKKINREGYRETPTRNRKFSPMLAQEFKYSKIKSWSKVAIQSKLDGIRCLATNKGLTTRKGVKITSMSHIDVTCIPKGIVLDGELYCHGMGFQDIQSIVRKENSTKQSELIKFHVFDLVSSDSFFERSGKLLLLEPVLTKCPFFTVVPTYKYNKLPEKDIFEQHLKEAVKEGYEGIMVRNGESPYHPGLRSDDLLKWKPHHELDATILDVLPGKERCGVFLCEYQGTKFKATPSWTKERKQWLLKNKDLFIGKIAEIKYSRFSDEGVPIHPVALKTKEP